MDSGSDVVMCTLMCSPAAGENTERAKRESRCMMQYCADLHQQHDYAVKHMCMLMLENTVDVGLYGIVVCTHMMILISCMR